MTSSLSRSRFLVVAAAALVLIGATPEPGSVGELDEPWITLDEPRAGLELEALAALAEMRGRVGVGLQGPQDVVLAVDTSGSVFLPSGIDLDGDGAVGAPACDFERYQRLTCPSYRRWTTDFDDIVLKVEISAALQLVGLLNPKLSRIGMVKFGDTVWVEQPVGEPDGVRGALERFRYVMRGGTDIAAALASGLDLLEAAPPSTAGTPQRAILLLSDGVVSMGTDLSPEEAARQIDAAIARARATRTRVFAFGVGAADGPGPILLAKLANETKGRYVAVPSAHEIAVELPLVSLSGVSDIELVNETTAANGRAARVFPDGTFDGFVPLGPGENTLRVTATLVDGRTLEARTHVTYSRPVAPSAAQIAERELLLEKLRTRTITTDLGRRIQAERRRRRLQQLELEVDDPGAALP